MLSKKCGLISRFKKLLAILLTIFIAASYSVLPAQAAVINTKNNSPEYNREILESLKTIFGNEVDAQRALEGMYRLGLLDGEGELVTSLIDVDGEMLTLDEIRELVNSEGVDLNKIAYIDGTPVSLANLKIMIEIEDELQRIKDTYFNDDITLNEAQRMALASLREQIETEGIMMLSGGAAEIDFPSGIDHTIYAEVDTAGLVCDNGSGLQSATVTLKDESGNTLAQVPDYNIRIPYRFVNGSARNGTNYSTSGSSVTFEANSTETSKTISFNILNDTSRFEGQKTFLLQYYDPQNVILQGTSLAAEKRITINGAYEWPSLAADYSVLQGSSIWDWPKAAWFYDWPQPIYATWPYYRYDVPDVIRHILESEGIYNKIEFKFKNTSGNTLSNCRAIMTIGNDYYSTVLGWDESNPDYESTKWPSEEKYFLDIGNLPNGQTAATVFDFYPDELSYTIAWNMSAIPYYHGYDPVTYGGSLYLYTPSGYLDKNVDGYYNIRFFDDMAPEVKSVTAPGGKIFEYGQSAPVTVEFSEPVDLSNVTMTVNGRTLLPEETGSRGTRFATFLYTINQNDYTYLDITDISGAVDLSGNEQADYAGVRLNDVIADLSKFYSFTTNATASVSRDGNGVLNGYVSIDITDDEELTLWLENEAVLNYDENVGKYKVPSISASIDGGTVPIGLYVDSADAPSKLEGTFVPELNTSEYDESRAVEFFYCPDPGNIAVKRMMTGKYAVYTVPPAVFLESGDFYITGDLPDDNIIFAQDNTVYRLSYIVTKLDATWRDADDFVWTGNNDEIATIDQDGTIHLTGITGTVSFTLTAENGGTEGKAVSNVSDELTVKVGLTPFLSIPEGVNIISINDGDSAEIRWTSNLIAKNYEKGQDTEFRIEMFAADYSGGTLQKGPSVYVQTVAGNTGSPITDHIIPASYLSGISVIGRHSYIVEVSSVNPYKTDEILKATAYVDISSRPAIVRLAKLDSYFLTDSAGQLDINWTLQNFDDLNEAEFELKVTDNSDGSPVYTKTSTNIAGGSHTFEIPEVDSGFKDTYTVTVRAKNAIDSTWSYDSFVLSIYSNEALKILIDGVAADSDHTMSNRERISSMSSEEILALKRDIYLKNYVSINYGEHAWGQISDQIRWSSSDSKVASVNYRQISVYDNIESLSFSSYRPGAEFILSGIKNGSTRITATHAATGMAKTVDVQVETLKDKLYLFQMHPKAKTTLKYINGNNEERTIDTNEKGELALYEESGIRSEIYMKSTFDGKQYMGTLYEDLVSSEKDSTRLELYPVNYFGLSEVATAVLYFKKPDGTPFSGDIILRGGVYKNGKYCPEARLNEKDGKADQIVTIGADGKFTVEMDPTQFWAESDSEELGFQDSFDFVFEVRFPGDTYYPHLLSINNAAVWYNTVRFGECAVRVETVPSGEKYKPFVAIQNIDFGFASGRVIDVRKFKGKIGPGQSSENMKLCTTVLWWGEDTGGGTGKHSVTFEDQYGVIPKGQSEREVIYPFSTIMATRNTFVLDRDTMDDWLESRQSRAMNLNMTDINGRQYIKKTMPYRIINMFDTEKAKDSSSLSFLLQTMHGGFGGDSGSLGLEDAVIGDGLNFLSGISTGDKEEKGMFSMIVSPTIDPTVFAAFIQVNLGNMSDDNVTGVYSNNNLDSDLDYSPSLFDILDMQKGKYLENQKKIRDKNPKEGLGKRNRNISFTLGGYMEAEIIYNFNKEKWEIYVLNGGFHAGGGVSYDWNYNAFVGPVPVTAQFTVGGTVEVDFKASIQRGEEIEIEYDSDSVNNYLTTLRIYAYVRAFAGIGFDYSVAALKIGLYGQVSVDAQFAFLNQPHISSNAINGRKLSVDGEVGVEFVAKFLFVSYEKVLASADFNIFSKAYGDWNKIQDTWEEIKKGSSGNPDILGYFSAPVGLRDGTVMYPVSDHAVIEDRSYLNEFERTWAAPARFGLFSLDPVSGVKDLETNSYPYSNPVLTDDGQIMLYVSDADSTDVEKTEVRWTRLAAGSYPDGTALDSGTGSHGDSQLKLAGDSDLAAAVWVMQSKGITKEAGDAVTNADIALMSNSTEIIAAVYDGTDWETTRLTDNATPDMAPAVAANGNRALAAWRSVYASDSSDPLDFSGNDRILYSIYDSGVWSSPQTLYNGTSGAVKGLEAAMLEDGTAAVTYTIDTTVIDRITPDPGAGGVSSGLETVYAIIDPAGNAVKNVRLTNDTYLDENPQVTAVHFDDGEERFVLGWYSVHDADGVKVNDVRLSAFDNEGILYDGFIDSISSINSNADVNISRNFRFAKNARNIEELSILWTSSQNAGISEEGDILADKDMLKAVRFLSDNGRMYITAQMDIAEMDDFTLIDHFNAYNAGSDTIRAVILGSDYDNGYRETTVQVMENGALVNKVISTPVSVSGLYTAAATYENEIEINSVAVDHTSVIYGMQIPVQFNVMNTGLEPISGIVINIGDNSTEFDDDFLLLPNDSVTLTALYDVPADRIINPEYTVAASFGNDLPAEIHSQTGTLYLDIPDAGISKLESLGEESGSRIMQVTLYNGNDAKLAGSGRNVRIGFYSDPEYTLLTEEVAGQESGDVFTVAPSDLPLVDAGAYTRQFTLDIADYVGHGNEIPEGGIRIYARVWVEETTTLPDGDTGTDTIIEYCQGNNYASILFESLAAIYDRPVSISTEQYNENGSTRAIVTVKNNSLVNTSSGNLIISLLDNSGKIMETRQCYDESAENRGLISLEGEETDQRVFSFDNEGSSLSVSYSNTVLGREDNANLASLSMTGIPLKYESGKIDYMIAVQDMKKTLVSAATEDPDATVTVNGSETEMGNAEISLGYGLNTIRIVVTAADGETARTYTVNISNRDTSTHNGDDSDNDGSDNDDSADDDSGDIENEAEKGKPYIFEPRAVAVNGTATVSFLNGEIEKLLREANGRQSSEIVIKPILGGEADRVILNLTGADFSGIVASGASLRLVTPLMSIVLDSAALADIAGENSADISIVLETRDNVSTVEIMSGGKILDIIRGGITALLPVQNGRRDAAAAVIHENGTDDIVKMSFVRGGVMIIPLSGSASFKVTGNAVSFTDTGKHWAKNSIDFVTARNLFLGTGKSEFSPDAGMTRGMAVTVLGRLNGADAGAFGRPGTGGSAGGAGSTGNPESAGNLRFSDIDNSAYYAPYTEWAAENRIIQGAGNNRFNPDGNITREQLAVMFANYMAYLGIKPSEQEQIPARFADDGEISHYAREAVRIVQMAGIMSGKGGNRFEPKGNATRAEVAAMIERLIVVNFAKLST